MSQQASLFDLAEGRKLRDQGLEAVAEHDPGWILRARRVAIRIAGETGRVAADTLREAMEARNDMPDAHHNIWGTVMSRHFFEKIPGSYRQSTTKSAHARNIPEYCLNRAGREEYERRFR